MGIQNVRRWHWLLIGVVLGPLLGYARLSMQETRMPAGEDISQSLFEKYLASVDGAGVPALHDLVVHPHPLDGRSYIVTGTIAETPVWVEATTPYTSSPDARGDSSVLAFLTAMQKENPRLLFRVAWWERPRYVLAAWTIGAIVIVGGIWPFLVNMLVFGTIFRPASAAEPATDKRLLCASEPQPERSDQSPEQDISEVNALMDAMAATLAAAPAGDQEPVCAPVGTPSRLEAAPAESSKLSPESPQKLFGGTEADFYPTELKVPQRPKAARQAETG